MFSGSQDLFFAISVCKTVPDGIGSNITEYGLRQFENVLTFI